MCFSQFCKHRRTRVWVNKRRAQITDPFFFGCPFSVSIKIHREFLFFSSFLHLLEHLRVPVFLYVCASFRISVRTTKESAKKSEVKIKRKIQENTLQTILIAAASASAAAPSIIGKNINKQINSSVRRSENIHTYTHTQTHIEYDASTCSWSVADCGEYYIKLRLHRVLLPLSSLTFSLCAIVFKVLLLPFFAQHIFQAANLIYYFRILWIILLFELRFLASQAHFFTYFNGILVSVDCWEHHNNISYTHYTCKHHVRLDKPSICVAGCVCMYSKSHKRTAMWCHLNAKENGKIGIHICRWYIEMTFKNRNVSVSKPVMCGRSFFHVSFLPRSKCSIRQHFHLECCEWSRSGGDGSLKVCTNDETKTLQRLATQFFFFFLIFLHFSASMILGKK